jgi:hypothetical protein
VPCILIFTHITFAETLMARLAFGVNMPVIESYLWLVVLFLDLFEVCLIYLIYLMLSWD